jgi:nucleotide-binding universal stress UspA family protein
MPEPGTEGTVFRGMVSRRGAGCHAAAGRFPIQRFPGVGMIDTNEDAPRASGEAVERERDADGRLVAVSRQVGPAPASAAVRVLVAADDSESADRALAHAMRLKQEHGWPLAIQLLNVQHFLAKEAAEAHLEEFGRRDTRAARARLDAAGLPYCLRIVMGYPAETIVRTARELRCEAIMMGTRGLGAIEGLLVGSVAYKVVHLSPLPVTLASAARPEGGEPRGKALRILLPVDGSPGSDRAVREVIGWVRRFGPAAVRVLNVQPPFLVIEELLATREELIERWTQKAGKEASRSARELLEAAGVAHEAEIAAGDDIAQTIVRDARESGCDLIVMGTRGTGAARGIMLGSVATKVVHLAQTPVTLVREPPPA